MAVPKMTIKELACALADSRASIERSKIIIEQMVSRKEELQAALLSAMLEQGCKTAETEDNIFSRAVKEDMVVEDEAAVVAELGKRGMLADYQRTTLDTLMVKGFAKAMLRETGEIMPGTRQKTTEYISIRAKKAGKDE